MTQRGAAISPEAREMIEAAASRANMSVTQWLNTVILDAAVDEGIQPVRYVFKEHREPATNSAKAGLTSLYSRLDDLAEKIEFLAQENFRQAAPEVRLEPRTIVDGRQQTVIFDRLTELMQTPSVEISPVRAPRRMSAMR